MNRTLKMIAEEINADPSLGLTAKVEKSRSSTDSQIAGTRLRREGKGRDGNKIEVRLTRNNVLVCQLDTSETYRQAREVDVWLTNWRAFRREYLGCKTPHWGQYRVEGEPEASRGKIMTTAQLLAATEGDKSMLVWVRVKDLGESFHRIDGPLEARRRGSDLLFCTPGTMAPEVDLDTDDPVFPKADEKLEINDDDGRIQISTVKLTPYTHKP